MFSKFNYCTSATFHNSYLNIGNKIYDKHQKEVQACLSKYISENRIIDGTNLKKDWFSVTKKDVFISHSHQDINQVKAFAGWLYKVFGIEAFIDSCSWGYCDELLNKIDKKYCYKPKTGTYDYSLRNCTTSHVHMMLSTALSEMINNTECIIFFNTPSSINISDELDAIKKKEKTTSPWIYHELMMTTLLRSNPPIRSGIVTEQFSHRYDTAQNELKINYDVSKVLESMLQLSDKDLGLWRSQWESSSHTVVEHALDSLYSIVFPK